MDIALLRKLLENEKGNVVSQTVIDHIISEVQKQPELKTYGFSYVNHYGFRQLVGHELLPTIRDNKDIFFETIRVDHYILNGEAIPVRLEQQKKERFGSLIALTVFDHAGETLFTFRISPGTLIAGFPRLELPPIEPYSVSLAFKLPK